jgi:predicted ATPase/DNA-binding CsgD family transcriptional regulator
LSLFTDGLAVDTASYGGVTIGIVSSMTEVARRPGILPGDVTSFVGRGEATADVRRLLSTARLVTLTGPGGAGKTRLALHIAHNLRRAFPDGVWLVKLAELRDESLVASTVASNLELPELTVREPEAVLMDYLAGKRVLLVLDNCEHLRDACGMLAATLLAATPDLHILTTSREPLTIAGEYIYPVPPMSLPVDTDLPRGTGHQYEALRLFAERAAAVRPGFTLGPDNERAVARLCRWLDGLPLAIEMAAVLTQVLSVEQIVDRLEDRHRLLTVGDRARETRHQTLRATMEWSFDLCSKQERALWAGLSVFAGEFDIEAAESVYTNGDALVDDIFPGIAGLVDKSILTREEYGLCSRYRMLATLRQFGYEKLLATGTAQQLRRRHRDYYLDLVERADREWFGPDQVEWVRRIQLDRPNLWAAMDYCLSEPNEAEAGLRIAGALWFFWSTAGSATAGRHVVDQTLALAPEPNPERAKALWTSAHLAVRQGDMATALSLLDECTRVARQTGNAPTLAHSLQLTGHAELLSDHLERAIPLYEQGLAHERALGPSAHLITVLYRLALARCLAGDVASGLALCQEAEAICEEHGERWSRAWMHWVLAVIRWVQDDPEQMTVHLRECLRTERPLADPLNIAICVEFLAWGTAARGKFERAAELLGASRKLWRPLGAHLYGTKQYLQWHDQCVDRVQNALGEKAFDAAYQRGAHREPDAIMEFGLEEHPEPDTTATRKPERSEAFTMLTPREVDVAKLIAQGLSNKEIAASLVISKRTAESHIEHILTKLNFTSRTRIASWFSAHRQA